jgi:hypothetical protein
MAAEEGGRSMGRGLMAGAALLALAACGRGDDAANRQAAAGPAQPPANIMVTTVDGRAEIRTGGGAASALPEGIPAYPGATTTGSVDVSGASAQGQGHVVMFSTGDSPAEVIAFYARAVAGAGYGIAQQMNVGPTAMLTAQKGEGEAVTITATQAGGATQVQIVAGHDRH